MTFRQIIGHNTQIKSLARAIAQQHQHHAYLFHGPKGVGKHTTALAYAATLLCSSPQIKTNWSDACGECISCHKVQTNQHPDLLLIRPEGQFIKIDQVRELIKQTFYRPYEAKFRVIILDNAHKVREEAGNALLKTLEEPSGETLFVLVTNQLSHLLGTIRSRSQSVRFGRLNEKEILKILDNLPEKFGTLTTPSLAEGSISRAIEVLTDEIFTHRKKLLHSLVKLQKSPLNKAFNFAEELHNSSTNLSLLLQMIITIYRDVLIVRETRHSNLLVHRDMKKEIIFFANNRSTKALLLDLDALLLAQRRILGNVNKKLLLYDLITTLRS